MNTSSWGSLSSRSMVVDHIYSTVLSNLFSSNRLAVLPVFNLSFSSRYVPPDWKVAMVVPILKPDKPPDRADSYRPISLTSCLAKIDAHRLLPTLQSGFRQGCSTSDHISSLEIQIMSGFRQNLVTASAFYDFTEYLMGWTDGQARTAATRIPPGMQHIR